MRAFVAIRQQIANPILFCRHVFLQNGSSKYHQSPSYVVFSFHLLFTTKPRKTSHIAKFSIKNVASERYNDCVSYCLTKYVRDYYILAFSTLNNYGTVISDYADRRYRDIFVCCRMTDCSNKK